MLTLGLLLAAGHIVASAQEAAGMTY